MYAQKMTALYARAGRMMQQFLDGICTVYALQPLAQDGVLCGGFADFAGWQPVEGQESLPCHLAVQQNGPAAADEDGSRVAAHCRLFLSRAEQSGAPPAGSRMRVEQQGQVFWLACSGLAASYPTHWEMEVKLLDERA